MSRGRLGIAFVLASGVTLADPTPIFEKDVLPVLQAKCLACHGPKARTAGLDLHEASLALRGGDNGPVIVKGAAEKSLLFTRIKAGTMPPGNDKLSPQEVELIKRWIDSGAASSAQQTQPDTTYRSTITSKDREFWSFRPLQVPGLPKTRNTAEQSNAIDAFLLAKLEAKGLHYSEPAAATALVRRAHLDLTGLPPTPEEVTAFVNDRNPNAFTNLVDRLLDSPHFGERWARYWLDLAGYVDVVGRDVQAAGYKVGEGRWRYRDYVIRAYQQDKPFNEFLIEQIAGDELFDRRNTAKYTARQLEQLTATGFMRTAEDPTDNPERDTPLLRYEVLHQTIDILSSSVLGVTVSCARCHNHKFDPIPQRDYYRIMATLTPAYNPVKWTPVLQRTLPEVSPAEFDAISQRNKEIDAKLKPVQAEREKLMAPHLAAWFEERLKAIPEKERQAIRTAWQAAPAKRNPRQKTLVAKLGDFDMATLPEEIRSAVRNLDDQLATLTAQRTTPTNLECIFDTGAPPETYIHRRGDHESKGDTVGPGGLEVLAATSADFEVKPPYEGTSGRRLALAQWLTKQGTPASALITRVYVNRLWSHIFGQGLVSTADNFGTMGSRPSHPELLEWLASEFQRNGWRTKPLLRTMMLSRAYRQGSAPADYKRAAKQSDPETADPENLLLHRMRLKRLESEAIRDSILAVSGKLNTTIGGPPVKTIAMADGMVVIDEKSLEDQNDRYRRSMYLVARRRYNLSLMGVFDHPVMSTNATSRRASAVVLQSLMMLNDGQVHQQSLFFADRIREKTASLPDQLDLAFRYAFSRTPAREEVIWGETLYAREKDRYLHAAKSDQEASREALASICHVLLNANEFLYVE